MSVLDPLEDLITVVEDLKIGSGIMTSRYFSTVRDGGMSREVFESSQQQFFYAVRFFSRAMAALAARVVDSQERFSLIHNLAEEHGLVDDDEVGNAGSQNSGIIHTPSGFLPSLAHDQTFRVFLNRLNSKESCGQKISTEQPAVHSFNLALWAVCAVEPTPVAFACLGAIEFAFADISALIGQCVIDREWISRDALVHYKLHAEIDKRHAGDFFAVVAEAWSTDATVRRQVESGIKLGLYLFKRLYDELMMEAHGHGGE